MFSQNKIIRKKDLTEGSLILGEVKKVNKNTLLIHLPDFNYGYMNIDELKIIYDEIGIKEVPKKEALLNKIVACIITGNETLLKLSIDPFKINAQVHKNDLVIGDSLWGVVKVVEDHGYSVETGLDVQCFVKTKKEYKLGEFDFFTIANIQNKLIQLDLLDCTSTGNSVLLGNYIPCTITSIVDNATVKLRNGSIGSINLLHYNFFEDKIDGATVLYVTEKFIGLSTRKLFKDKSSYKVGDYINGKIIKNYFNGVLYSTENKIPAFSLKADTWSNAVSQNNYVKLRIKENSKIFGCLLVSNKPDFMSETILDVLNIKTGQIITGTVADVNSFGVKIRISSLLFGFIYNYLTDNLIPEVGASVDCRVVHVDISRNKIVLTSNPIIVQSSLPIIDSYIIPDDPKIWYLGFVEKSQKSYLIIKFFNNVSGMLHKSETSITQFDDLTHAYTIGTPIKVHVVSSDPSNNRLVLSARDSSNSKQLYESSSFIIRLTRPNFTTHNYFNVFVDDVDKCQSKTVVIPDQHLTDFSEHIPYIKKLLQSSPDEIITGVYLGKDMEVNSNIASLKFSILRSVETDVYPKSFDDIEIGMYLPGYVLKSSSVGFQIMIGFNVIGFLPAHHITQSVLIGQSLLVYVDEIDHSKKRIILTLERETKQLKIVLPSFLYGSGLLLSFFKQHDYISKHLCSKHIFNRGKFLSFKILKNKSNFYIAETHGIPSTIFSLKTPNLQIGTDVKALCVYWDMDPLHIYAVVSSAKSNVKGANSIVILKNFKRFSLGLAENSSNFYPVFLVSRETLSEFNQIQISTNSVIDITLQNSISNIPIAYPKSNRHFPINIPPISGTVTKITSTFLKVIVNSKTAFVHISNVDSVVREGNRPLERFNVKDTVDLYTISRKNRYHTGLSDCNRKSYELSLIPRSLSTSCSIGFKIGDTVIGFVSSYTKRRAFIEVTSSIKGFINIIDLKPFDGLLHDPLERFIPGTALSLTIVAIDTKSQLYTFSRTQTKSLDIEQTVTGRIYKTDPKLGLCVDLPYSNIGLVHITNICTTFKNRPLDDFPLYSYVTCKILRKVEKNKYSLGIKQLHCEETSQLTSSKNVLPDHVYQAYITKISQKYLSLCLSETISCKIVVKKALSKFGPGWNRNLRPLSVVSVQLDKIINEQKILVFPVLQSFDNFRDENVTTQSLINVAPLKVGSGFDWNSGQFVESCSKEVKIYHIQSDEKSNEKPQKSLCEQEIRAIETRLASNEWVPTSLEDFDRLIVTSPNSSIVWIGYMSFYLQSMELDKARKIAERALKSISFREDKEVFNLWVAIINIECIYGTPESLDDVYSRARNFCNKKKINKHLIELHQSLNHDENAEKECLLFLKFYSQSKKAYIMYGKFLALKNRFIEMKQLLRKAIQNLPEKKHIQTILQFSLLEFKFGDPQRGCTLIDKILSSFPNRLDIWYVYIDQLIKASYYAQARLCLEKLSSLPFKKMKQLSILNKFKSFEEKYGDSGSLSLIEQKISQIS
ncbi:hypothetical protein HZS_6146 [Henneguya salminicola]|nr:hypothetical protein HZS_6146 [Henneguya salminicola]